MDTDVLNRARTDERNRRGDIKIFWGNEVRGVRHHRCRDPCWQSWIKSTIATTRRCACATGHAESASARGHTE